MDERDTIIEELRNKIAALDTRLGELMIENENLKRDNRALRSDLSDAAQEDREYQQQAAYWKDRATYG